MKLWAKLITESKIQRDEIFVFSQKLSLITFEDMLRTIAEAFDLSTPLVLQSQYSHFLQFNVVRFKQCDFIDNLGYDCLEIENC